MNAYTLGIHEAGHAQIAVVGGKAAGLGELSGIPGIRVPAAFCVTTAAYREVIGNNEQLGSLLEQLSALTTDDRDGIGEVSGRIRRAIEGTAIPTSIADDINRHLEQLGDADAYAVRSSATAEDLPTASFAGQQDSRGTGRT